MPLIRFRLRTLMIAVAVVAVATWAVIAFPIAPIVGLFLFGPLVGVCWAAFLPEGRPLDSLKGAVVGGVVQGGVMAAVIAGLYAYDGLIRGYRLEYDTSVVAIHALSLEVGSVIAGLIVGLIVVAALLTISWRRHCSPTPGPASEVDPPAALPPRGEEAIGDGHEPRVPLENNDPAKGENIEGSKER